MAHLAPARWAMARPTPQDPQAAVVPMPMAMARRGGGVPMPAWQRAGPHKRSMESPFVPTKSPRPPMDGPCCFEPRHLNITLSYLMHLFPRGIYLLLASLNYSMNVFPRGSYFLLAALDYLMNVFSTRCYFLLALLNYVMNQFPRRSYFRLASLKSLLDLFPRRSCFQDLFPKQIYL